MTCLDTARQYLEAWNAHDADAIVETFAGDGIWAADDGIRASKFIQIVVTSQLM